MSAIVVVDYGMGNLRSVAKALAHVAPGRDVVVSADPVVIRAAERVVLPGQSAMPDCMTGIAESGLESVVREVLRDRPFLGICLGLQMLFERQRRGPDAGLSVLPGRVVRFATRECAHRAASVSRSRTWAGARFAMSGRTRCGRASRTARASISRTAFTRNRTESGVTVGTADYPVPFTCAIARANIFATQFHPEKSQRAGLRLLQNFVAWNGRA